MDENTVTEVLIKLKENFVYFFISIGKKHIWGGVNINSREDNKIEIQTNGQFEYMIECFQKDIGATVTSPVARHILTVDNIFEQLSE